ncbi:DUF2793 domain-containing protein [Pelosinus sp. UFO1]|uniref:DUF2793 domain-containing protein n=1 Tax=Pelosinus sp. UFO1 TaxID=484770 RepID=UPI0004D14358|nr:DUF2793 domain-containing protein [Pelosinus sp. UFO1]AIF51996.1 Protein of unknown function DUF2793 [Pelosinus sp. UFO1]
MSDKTPNLGLPYIVQSQAQKEVTHNQGLNLLDFLVDRTVKDKDMTAPPASPLEGDAYIIPSSSTGVWAGKDGQIAQFIGGAWDYYIPRQGWLLYVIDEDKYYKRGSSTWLITAI